MLLTPTLLAPTLSQLLWGYRPWKTGPRGVCAVHRPIRYWVRRQLARGDAVHGTCKTARTAIGRPPRWTPFQAPMSCFLCTSSRLSSTPGMPFLHPRFYSNRNPRWTEKNIIFPDVFTPCLVLTAFFFFSVPSHSSSSPFLCCSLLVVTFFRPGGGVTWCRLLCPLFPHYGTRLAFFVTKEGFSAFFPSSTRVEVVPILKTML